MKYVLILITALILHAETHHFQQVNHNGRALENVQLILNDSKLGFDIRYADKLLKRGAYMIVSCRTKEGFCLVDNNSSYNWIER